MRETGKYRNEIWYKVVGRNNETLFIGKSLPTIRRIILAMGWRKEASIFPIK